MLKKKYLKTKDEWEITFEFQNRADTVSLVSEINNWEPIEMKQRKKDKIFYTKMRLPKDGEYQFRYLIDEYRWENDEAADAYVGNDFGSDNSVVKIPSSLIN